MVASTEFASAKNSIPELVTRPNTIFKCRPISSLDGDAYFETIYTEALLYIRRLISEGKMRIWTSRPGKTNEYFETKLGRSDCVIRSTNSPNLVQIGCEIAWW